MKNYKDNFPTIPSKYEARVEVNWQDEKRSTEMRVFFDSSVKRAAVEMKENNTITRLIFNYETDEIYKLTCKI